MGNEAFRLELNNLTRKVKLLLSEHQRLKEEVINLQIENENLRIKLSERDKDMSNFQNRMKISKIVENMVVGEENTAELKEVIDDYIKEIDKCIAHLGEA